MSNLYRLLTKLVKAETVTEVKEILDGIKCQTWHPMGDRKDNYKDIKQTTTNPCNGLGEKGSNSSDTYLEKACIDNGVDPLGGLAPKSPKEACSKLLNVTDADYSSLTKEEKDSLPRTTILVTGEDTFDVTPIKKPSVMIIDEGLGQDGKDFKNTFLSLSSSNKVKMPFTQGKYNHGGTAALNFTKHELIVSRKGKEYGGEGKISFTITREHHYDGEYFPVFEYLKIDGEIPSFTEEKGNPLLVFPDKEKLNLSKYTKEQQKILTKEKISNNRVRPYKLPFKNGTVIKLYEYEARFNGGATFSIYYEIIKKFWEVYIPITLYELRDYYNIPKFDKKNVLSNPHTPKKEFYGLKNLITGNISKIKNKRNSSKSKKDKENIIENLEDTNPLCDGFPKKSVITIKDIGDINVSICLFDAKKDKSYSGYIDPSSAVCFVNNGQVQGGISNNFFEKKNLGYSRLKNNLLVIMDMSDINYKVKSKLFMPDREHLTRNDQYLEIISCLEENLANDQDLLDEIEKIKDFEKNKKLKESECFTEYFSNFVDANPKVVEMLNLGTTLNYFKTTGQGNNTSVINGTNKRKKKPQKPYKGLNFPTFLSTPKNQVKVPINKKVNLIFKTDVVNTYPLSNIQVSITGTQTGLQNNQYTTIKSLNRGIIKIHIPKMENLIKKTPKVNVKETLTLTLIGKKKNFTQQVDIIWVDPCLKQPKPPKKKYPKTAMPHPIPVTKEEWHQYNMNEKSFTRLVEDKNETTIYINIDNLYLEKQKESCKKEVDKKDIENKFAVFGMLYTLSKKIESEDSTKSNEELCKEVDGLAPTVIPLCDYVKATVVN